MRFFFAVLLACYRRFIPLAGELRGLKIRKSGHTTSGNRRLPGAPLAQKLRRSDKDFPSAGSLKA